MKPIHILIVSSTLLVAAIQVADAQQGSQRNHRARAATMGGDPLMSDMIVSDSMVLPLLGASDHVEGRLAFLKTELQITPAQLPLWNAFADARVNAAQENVMINDATSITMVEGTAPSLPQRLDAQEKRLTTHLRCNPRLRSAGARSISTGS